MRPFEADPASSFLSSKVPPALTSFADEVCATAARLFAYLGSLALAVILTVHFWHQLPEIPGRQIAPKLGWTLAGRSQRELAPGAVDQNEKSGTYTSVRHPAGGRNELTHRTDRDPRPPAGPSGDWITDPKNPPLRGVL